LGVTVSDAAGELLVLRKARDNKMWRHEVGHLIYDDGRPLKPWLLPHFQRLLADGHLMIVARRYTTGVSERVELTPLGRERLWVREREWRGGLG
jgi:hypothetical protein